MNGGMDEKKQFGARDKVPGVSMYAKRLQEVMQEKRKKQKVNSVNPDTQQKVNPVTPGTPVTPVTPKTSNESRKVNPGMKKVNPKQKTNPVTPVTPKTSNEFHKVNPGMKKVNPKQKANPVTPVTPKTSNESHKVNPGMKQVNPKQKANPVTPVIPDTSNKSHTQRYTDLAVRLGWKHFNLSTGTYKQVEKVKEEFNICKGATLEEVERLCCKHIFRDGVCTGLKFPGVVKLSECNYFVSKYNGDKLPLLIDGVPFKFEEYRKKYKSSPLRLYLHTRQVDSLPAAVMNRSMPATCPTGAGQLSEDESSDAIDCHSYQVNELSAAATNKSMSTTSPTAVRQLSEDESSDAMECSSNQLNTITINYICFKRSIYSQLLTTISIRNIAEVRQYLAAREPSVMDCPVDQFDPISFDFMIHRVYVNSFLAVEGNSVGDKMTYNISNPPGTEYSDVPGVSYVLLGDELGSEEEMGLPIIVLVMHSQAAVVWTLNDEMISMAIKTISVVRPKIYGPGIYKCSVGTNVISEILVDQDYNMTEVATTEKKICVEEEVLPHCSTSCESVPLRSLPVRKSSSSSVTSVDSGMTGGLAQETKRDSEKKWSVVAPKDLKIGEMIKEGGMSTVYKADYLGTTVAAKKVLTSGRRRGRIHTVVEKELNVHAVLHCHTIAQLVGYCQATPQYGLILIEFIQGPDMDEFIFDEQYKQMYNTMTTMEMDKIGRDMVSSIAYLHGQSPQIVHQDLKPGNYVLRLSDKAVKLIDLGLGKFRQFKTIGRTACIDAVEGTLSYMPPEKLLSSKDGSASGDVWSLAACLCELFTRAEIWTVPDDVQNEMSYLTGLMEQQAMPEALKDLKKRKNKHFKMLNMALNYDSECRCSAMDICRYFNKLCD